MKNLFCVILLLLFFSSNAQSSETLKLLSDHLSPTQKINTGGIEVSQFLDNCIYDHKCGVFLKGSFREFGPVKGFFLSIDRRLRCTQIAKGQIPGIRINQKGEAMDHWKSYRFETK
ncbi:MAG: membrane protein insertion efficiency factor YidD [Cyclobacteriaceae bacterium]